MKPGLYRRNINGCTLVFTDDSGYNDTEIAYWDIFFLLEYVSAGNSIVLFKNKKGKAFIDPDNYEKL